jgi:hypothetical protein
MKLGYSTRTTRIAGLSALGLGIGLALTACNPSTSSAGAAASSAAASSAATPSASAPAATAPAAAAATASAAASGTGSTGGSGTNATPENVNGQPPVLFDCEGNTQVEPKTYDLDCFDAINELQDLHWTQWGQTAVATGTEELNYCVPSCSTHASTYYPVSIQVDGSGDGSDNRTYYTEMTISYAGAMPAISNAETGGVITQRTTNSWSEKLPIATSEKASAS